jgi:membrane protease subunit HflK
VAAAYQRAPAVTRERLYLEAMESVLGRANKVIIDTKVGPGGNVIYLPLDKLTGRSGTTPPDAGPAADATPSGDQGLSLPAAGPTATAEPDSDAGRQSGRSRSDR